MRWACCRRTPLPADWPAHRLGLEVAGRVLRTGPSVRHVQAGDDVIARVADGFCGRVIAPAHCVVHRPKRLTPQQAAAVPARLHHGLVFVVPSGTHGPRRDGA